MMVWKKSLTSMRLMITMFYSTMNFGDGFGIATEGVRI